MSKLCIDCKQTFTRLRNGQCTGCWNRLTWNQPNNVRKQKLEQRNAEIRGGRPYADRDWLYQKYVVEKLSIRDIAKVANCGHRTVARWMQTHDIATRDNIESLIGCRSKEKHSRWKGGISPYDTCPVCNSKKIRSSIRCRNCYRQELSKQGIASHAYKGVADIMVSIRGWAADNWRPQI